MNQGKTPKIVLLALFALSACGLPNSKSSSLDFLHKGTGQTLAPATDLPPHCFGPEIVRISRPVVNKDSSLETHSYAFRFKAPEVVDKPVLVFLPGGPGQTSMESPPEFLPAGWGYLMIDPRGIGCNALANPLKPTLAENFYRTEEFAFDTIAAIQKVDLKNYVLFGISYGTLHASRVASELERQSLPGPQAVVLEGVLGRAFTDVSAGEAFIHNWDATRALLPAEVLKEFDESNAPFGIDAEAWAGIISSRISVTSPKSFAATLSLLSNSNAAVKKSIINILLSTIDDDSDSLSPGVSDLYRYVACREIADTAIEGSSEFLFARGRIVRNSAKEGTGCGKLKMTQPFDSANFQFSAKTYYFSGENDVNTPPWQADYHYSNHRGSAVHVLSKDSGHNSFQSEQLACAPVLLENIAQGGLDLAKALSTCPKPSTMESK